MEMENIIKLIQTVSESSLTSFKYTEGDSSLALEINRDVVYGQAPEIQVTPVLTDMKTEKEKADAGKLTITSPMVGTFYTAKSEGNEPYINVGDHVKKGQIIGIVEAMKLMNEIESAYDGIVEAILVKNKDMVEYGQALVSIRPL
ncbi:MAG: acetyl-CoA carboxylase biotin carboxyl carrier protein [Anaerocolumna sp.]